jgi:predicted acylesterase/phospholipase RssA
MAEGANVPLTDPASYRSPDKECDLVMKGGITSGVVYPLAVCRLATTYTLRQIGGTSAGAIAAATAAAAEYGREAGGFVKLAALPTWLAEPASPAARGSNLRSLFQPAPATRKPFSVIMALVERGAKPTKIARLVGRALVAHPLAGLVGALPGLLLAALGLWMGGGAAVPATVAGLALALVGMLAGLLAGGLRYALRVLPKTGFGLCPGSPGLTDWLAAQIDELAGIDQGRPLTFGDLAARGIRLRMLTTSVTHGLPRRLPFDDRQLLYDSTRLRELFPKYVVDHMDAHAEPPSSPVPAPAGVTLLHLPDVEHLPVVFAVRMSLSFPLLLSAVPLWAVDYGGTDQAEPVWFSDGGITSNFPVHFFDALLPTRPTFAINLGPGENLDPSDQRQNIVVPTRAASGILPRWTHINGVVDFGRAILDTMQNWSDNNQARMPGYRDRIICVLHAKDEGGLNLDMRPTTITDLSARGEAAAIEFLQFALAQHRWTRYRSSMAVLERTMAAYRASYDTVAPDVPSYSDMIDDPPRSYSSDWTRPKAAFARVRTDGLLGVAAAWPDDVHTFSAGEPSPAPILRVTPDV